MSNINGTHAKELKCYLPGQGDWYADVLLTDGDPPVGAVTFTVGDLVFSSHVTHSGLDSAGSPHAILVGAPGWQTLVVRPLSFQSDGGVKLSTVLSAISAAAGEPIEQPPDRTIGNYYECVASRPGEPVTWADVLSNLYRSGYISTWRVDPDGVTRFTARTGTAVASRATPLRRQAQLGLTVYGLDSPLDFLPGNTIESSPIGRVLIRETAGKIEADVYATGASPSPRELLRRIVAAEIGDRFRTYVVAAVGADGRLDLAPPADAQHLPEMHNVEQWTLGVIKIVPAVGSECLVIFRDERKTRPVALVFAPDYDGAMPIARSGDTVKVMFPPNMVIAGTVTGPPPGPFTGIITIAGSSVGVIQGGSTKASAKT